MSVVKIKNFGGELPAVSPRELPADAAQANVNLLLTSNEFRPLRTDKDITAATQGAKTLHRVTRNSDGTLRTGESSGWITDIADKNYVRGQLNDDATERTSVTWNDGTQPPRAIDAKGGDRPLGVPKPTGVGVSKTSGTYFAAEQAQNWVDAELVPELVDILRNALLRDDIGSRYGAAPVAGATGFGEMLPTPGKPGTAYYPILKATAESRGLLAPELGGWEVPAGGGMGITWRIPVAISPYWGYVNDVSALKNQIRAIESPKTGSQLFTEDQITWLADKMVALFDPNGELLRDRRDQMNAARDEFLTAVKNTGGQSTPRPTEPAKPTVPEYSWAPGKDSNYVRHPQWIAYDQAYALWRQNMDAWLRGEGDAKVNQAGIVSAALEAQTKAQRLSDEIEAEYRYRLDSIESLLRAAVESQGIISAEGGGGLIEVDADPIVETRFYIATWVDDWGRESAPGPVSVMVEANQYDEIHITMPAPPAGRFLQMWRLYRSNVGTQSAAFQFVDEFLVATLNFQDTVPNESLGEVCPTMTWDEPPYRQDENSVVDPRPPKGADPYLKGLVGLPNGINAGFVDNFVAFCHPYYPYAWPTEYQITTEHPIVGLGVFGQTLFVGTMGYPYLITGADSASMSADKRPEMQPCVSRRSIASAEGGVLYASPDGICLASPSGVSVVTTGLFTHDEWQAMNPDQLQGVVYENVYYFWSQTDCWALDFVAKKLGRVTGFASDVTAVATDVLTKGLYAVHGSRVIRLFAGSSRRTGRWRTPKLVMPRHGGLAWLQIDGKQNAGDPVTVRWYGDDILRHTAVRTDIDPSRLPAGRWLEHEVEIESAARLTKVLMTSSTQELQSQ